MPTASSLQHQPWAAARETSSRETVQFSLSAPWTPPSPLHPGSETWPETHSPPRKRPLVVTTESREEASSPSYSTSSTHSSDEEENNYQVLSNGQENSPCHRRQQKKAKTRAENKSTKSILKPYSKQDLHIRQDWHQHAEQAWRAPGASENIVETDTTCVTCDKPIRSAKRVSFHQVHVRYHSCTLGDNPHVMLPVTMNWDHRDSVPVSVRAHQQAKAHPRRRGGQLRLSVWQRQERLLAAGVTIDTLQRQIIRRQRQQALFQQQQHHHQQQQMVFRIPTHVVNRIRQRQQAAWMQRVVFRPVQEDQQNQFQPPQPLTPLDNISGFKHSATLLAPCAKYSSSQWRDHLQRMEAATRVNYPTCY